MKFLQNKVTVSILALGALVLVLAQFGLFGKIGSLTSPAATSPDTASTETAAGKPQASTASTASLKPSRPDRPLDLDRMKQRISRWVKTPQRDPFQFFTRHQDAPRAADLLTLSAIWHQTGSQLAVINQKVLEEGDQIQSFQLERIEGERVWVRGPGGLEPLDLKLVQTESQQKRKFAELSVRPFKTTSSDHE